MQVQYNFHSAGVDLALKIPIWNLLISSGVRGGGWGAASPPGWKIQGTLWFSGQAQVSQTFWMLKVYSMQWKIQGELYFSGQAQVVQNSEWQKNMYLIQWIQGKLCFSGQAQVVQNSEW